MEAIFDGAMVSSDSVMPAPSSRSVSVPVPPSMRRKVRSETARTSLPAPPRSESAPPPPVSVSLPVEPIRISAAVVPVVTTVFPKAPPKIT